MNSTQMNSITSNSRPQISLTEKNGSYFLRLPYSFNDLFRTIFKLAEWNAFEKAFVAKANTANKNKWAKFVDAANGLSSDMDAAAEAESTSEELKALSDKAEAMRSELQRKIKECKAKEGTLRAQIAHAQELVLELSPFADSAAAAVTVALAEAREADEKLQAAAAPAMAIFAANGVEGIFDKMVCAARRGHLGKADLNDAQDALITVRRQLLAAGYEHKLIHSICGHSLNRSDKFYNDIPRARETLLTGLEKAE